MKIYQSIKSYLPQKLLRDVPDELIREFERSIRVRNARSMLILTCMCLIFLVVTVALDLLRYNAGLFETSQIYFLLLLSHLMFGFQIIPLGLLWINWERIKTSEFRHTKKVISYTVVFTSVALLTMTILTIIERGSVLMYAIYIMTINFIVLLPHRWRIWFNLISFVLILIAIILIKRQDLVAMAINIVEVIGITIPGFFISTLRYNDKVWRFLIDRRLIEQKNIIEEEREKSERLLLNILPQDIAQELKEKGCVAPKHYEQVAILFSDFSGFTQLSQEMTAAELVEELDACFTAFDKIMHRHYLEKIKTLGDGYLAIGGIEENDELAVCRMVEAAKDVLDFIHNRKKENALTNKPGFDIRIGIHCGPVVAGVVGKSKFTFDIWGSSVNIASRMESAGAKGRINVSENVYQIIHTQYACEARGEIEVKGIGKTQMYFVKKD